MRLFWEVPAIGKEEIETVCVMCFVDIQSQHVEAAQGYIASIVKVCKIAVIE